MTVIALTLDLIAGNLVKPGGGFEGQAGEAGRESAQAQIDEAGGDTGLVAIVTEDLLPDSLAGLFVEKEIPRVLIIALLVAASVSFLRDRDRKRVVAVFEVVSRIIFGVIRLIMWAAPLGAFGGMAYTVSVVGSQSLANHHGRGRVAGGARRRALPGGAHPTMVDRETEAALRGASDE